MFNLKSFVLNRRFLAKPKRVNSLWSLGLSKTFLLICLLVITGGVNHRVSAADYVVPANPLSNVAEIKTDGSVKYALQATYIQDYATSGHFLNRFLANAGVSSVISIGNTTKKSDVGSTYTNINSLLNASDVENHLFTFETQSDGTIKVKNCNDNTYWGLNTSKRPYPVSGVGSATSITFTLDSSHSGMFILSLNGIIVKTASTASYYLSVNSGSSYYNSTYKNISFKIWPVEEKKASAVNYKFFDTSDKQITALAKNGVAITEGSTVASLSGVTIPSYVNATYYTDAAFTSEVAGTSTPEADKTYYVKTRYKSGMPFVLGGTYFALGKGSNYLYNHDKTSGNDQYAIKMSGDWYNGFVVQDSSDKYLSDAAGTFSGTVGSKLQIELTDDNYFLKSVRTGNYISLSADAVAYVANIALATPLSNLSETKAGEILAAYPAARYVGTYSSTQTGVDFNDIVKGNGKIAREASKYYFVEQAANTDYLLSSVNSSQELINGGTVYAVSGSNGGDNFAALWSFNNKKLTNINTGQALSPQAELGAGTTAIVDASSVPVPYANPQNIQAYWISLEDTGVYNYLKQNGNETIVASAAAPGAEGYWYLREAETFTIKMNAVGGQSYATVYAPVALAKPAGETAKLYTAAFSTDKKSLVLTEITSEVIAKETPIVLISESAAASAKLALSYAAGEEQTSDMEGCILKQLFDADANRKDYRTLGRNGVGEVGFFVPSASVTNIPANRAYLNIPEGSTLSEMTKNLVLRFEDGTETGIAPSELFGTQEQQPAVIFDLSGRRVQQAAKGGIYIMNGKKIYVK